MAKKVEDKKVAVSEKEIATPIVSEKVTVEDDKDDTPAIIEDTAEVPGYTTEDGKIYGLSERTPKTLRVLDTTYTQEELLQNAEAMEFLIVGRSCFVKRLK
jgi:uncharacterized protein YpuA (DUF1002 family)